MAPQVGLEPTTLRLTAEQIQWNHQVRCDCVELRRAMCFRRLGASSLPWDSEPPLSLSDLRSDDGICLADFNLLLPPLVTAAKRHYHQ